MPLSFPIKVGIELPKTPANFNGIGQSVSNGGNVGNAVPMLDGSDDFIMVPTLSTSSMQGWRADPNNTVGTILWTLNPVAILAGSVWQCNPVIDPVNNIMYTFVSPPVSNPADLQLISINIKTGAFATIGAIFTTDVGLNLTGNYDRKFFLQLRDGNLLLDFVKTTGFRARYTIDLNGNFSVVEILQQSPSTLNIGVNYISIDDSIGIIDQVPVSTAVTSATIKIVRKGLANNCFIPYFNPYGGGTANAESYLINDNNVMLIQRNTAPFSGNRYFTRVTFDKWLHDIADLNGMPK